MTNLCSSHRNVSNPKLHRIVHEDCYAAPTWLVGHGDHGTVLTLHALSNALLHGFHLA